MWRWVEIGVVQVQAKEHLDPPEMRETGWILSQSPWRIPADPWFWTSGLYNCERKNDLFLSNQLWWFIGQSKETDTAHVQSISKSWQLNPQNISRLGHLGGSVVGCLPFAQVVIPGSWDGVPHQLPTGSLLLPLPMSLPLSVCLLWINKYNIFKKMSRGSE